MTHSLLRFVPSFLACAALAAAAAPDPIQWTLALDAHSAPPGAKVTGRLTAVMEPGWHLYSPTTPPGGPNPTTLALAPDSAIASVRFFQPKPDRKFDPNFQLDTETFENQVTFVVEAGLAGTAPAGVLKLVAQVRYQSCTDKICLPPKKKTAEAAITVAASAAAPAFKIPAGYEEIKPVSAAAAAPAAGGAAAAGAPPVTPAPVGRTDTQDLGRFLVTAFVLGLASIFTPCVFPMIPITVSFFLNRQGTGGEAVERRNGVLHALVFCVGIIVLFTGLGWLAKAIAGPFGVVILGSNPWVNGFITAVFVVFGLSLLGAFELTLPSGLLTRLNAASEGGGYLATLVMGLTFTLTSFACIGPIVGPLFVASVQSEGLQPVFGMFSFATGLAAPFFFLALFPAYLRKLPRSGGWMVRVKVVLGFLVVAAAVNYLNKVNEALQVGWLTRERFLAAWVVLLILPGLYLLGILRMEGIKAEERLGVGRALTGALFLILALSLVPGMFGAPLGELDAYVPAPTASVGRGGGSPEANVWMRDDFQAALARARQEGKPLFVNFSGHACTNCHWMERNMLGRPEIQAALQKFVLVQLFTDGLDDASARNQDLENTKFSTIAIPYYAILDARENVIATFPGLTRDPKEFLAFLNSGAAKSGG